MTIASNPGDFEMASLKITIIVSADPSENVHSHVVASAAEIWEVGPMLDRAIADLQAERASLPLSHSSTSTGTPDGR